MKRTQPVGESAADHADMAKRPLIWQWVSRDLLAAANALHRHRRGPGVKNRSSKPDERIDTSPAPILLLYGMALENLLKGLLIAQGTAATTNGVLNRELQTHDVLNLWRRAGLPVDAESEELLSALRWAVESGGRYPVGLRPNPSNLRHLRVGGVRVELFLALFETAEEALRAATSEELFAKADLMKWGV